MYQRNSGSADTYNIHVDLGKRALYDMPSALLGYVQEIHDTGDEEALVVFAWPVVDEWKGLTEKHSQARSDRLTEERLAVACGPDCFNGICEEHHPKPFMRR